MSIRWEKIEAVAEAIWQAESLRASGRNRRIPWSDCGHKESEKYRLLAKAAIKCLDKISTHPTANP